LNKLKKRRRIQSAHSNTISDSTLSMTPTQVDVSDISSLSTSIESDISTDNVTVLNVKE